MNQDNKLKLKQYSYGELHLLKDFFKQEVSFHTLNDNEKKELLTKCAMLATVYGKYENMVFLIEQDRTILKEKECGIFRMTAEIEDYLKFIKIIKYLFNDENKEYINIHANEDSFLRECIKKDKLDYIKYLVEYENVELNINELLLKIILRNKNPEIFEYFMLDIKSPIKENSKIENWMAENYYQDQWIQIKKRNLYLNLNNELKSKEKEINLKFKKI